MGRRFSPGKPADLSPHLSFIDFAAEVPPTSSMTRSDLRNSATHLMSQAPAITEQATAELERRYGLPTGSIIPRLTLKTSSPLNPFPFWLRGRIRHIARNAAA